MRDLSFTKWLWITSIVLIFIMNLPSLAAEAPQRASIANGADLQRHGAGLSLGDLEQMALEGNPTLAQAVANVEAARGRAMQAGRYPNPTVGYEADRIGAARTAGELQGLFVDQTIVTAGKLKLDRARFAQKLSRAEALALVQQYRVLNGVRMRFYQLLAMQRLLDVRSNLLNVADDAANTTEELVNVGAANRPDLLQARIEARQERVALENARTLYVAAWQQLAAFVGNPSLPASQLDGDLEAALGVPDFDTTLEHLLQASPEVQAARSEVTSNEFALKREQVEPIPNVEVRVSNGYDFETRNNVTSVSVGVRLPLFDKNQGNIHAARAQLAHARAELCRVELSLRQRLARAYARYRTALTAVDNYRKYTLPEAKEAYELYLDSFQKRRAAWPQVLVAQHTYFHISVEFAEALEELRRAEVAILGLLLVDGMDKPPAALGTQRVPQADQTGQGLGLGNRVENTATSGKG